MNKHQNTQTPTKLGAFIWFTLLSQIQVSHETSCFSGQKLLPSLQGTSGSGNQWYSIDYDPSIDALIVSGLCGDGGVSITSGWGYQACAMAVDTNFNYLWGKYYSSQPRLASQLDVKKGGGKALILMDSSNAYDTNGFQFVYADTSTGATLFAYKDPSNAQNAGWAPNGINIYVDENDNGYFLMKTSSSGWTYFKILLTSATPTTTFKKYLSSGGGNIYSVNNKASTSQILMGGQVYISSVSYASIVALNYDGTVGTMYGYSRAVSYHNLHQIYDNANYVYACAQFMAYSSDLMLLDSSLSLLKMFLVADPASSRMTCDSAYGESQMAYFYFEYTSSDTVLLITVDFSADTYITTTFTSMSNQVDHLFNAVHLSGTESYYTGYIQSLTDTNFGRSYGTPAAYIMPQDPDYSCLTFSGTTSSPIAITYYSATWTSLAMTVTTATAATMTDPTSYFSTHSWTAYLNRPDTTFCTYKKFFTTPTIASQTYLIGCTTKTFTHDAFTFTRTCSDLSFTYTSTLSSGSALPSWITYTASTRTHSVSTSTAGNAGTQTIKVLATAPDGSSAYQTFSLVVSAASCTGQTITATTTAAYAYSLGASSHTLSITPFTVSSGTCSTVTYTLTNNDNSALDSSIFTFSSTSLVIQTSDTAKAGTYTLKLTGTIDNSCTSTTTTFVITVQDECYGAALTTSTITTPQSYTVGDAALSFTFTDWTSSMTSCGSMSYTATLADASALPSFITFTGSSRTFSIVIATDLTLVNSYSILVTGVQGGFASTTKAFTLNVLNPCSSATITPSTMTAQTYTIGTSAASVQFCFHSLDCYWSLQLFPSQLLVWCIYLHCHSYWGRILAFIYNFRDLPFYQLQCSLQQCRRCWNSQSGSNRPARHISDLYSHFHCDSSQSLLFSNYCSHLSELINLQYWSISQLSMLYPFQIVIDSDYCIYIFAK